MNTKTKKQSQKKPPIYTKRFEPTYVADHLLVVGERIHYQYGDDSTIEKTKNMDEFLLEILNLTGGITRSQLVKLTHIPRTTLYDNLAKLIEQGKVETEYLHDKKNRGRPKTIFKSI